MNHFDRFYAKIEKASNDCWLWLGSKNHNGYGQFHVSGIASRRAHRISWELFVGKVPAGLLVLHRCDNRSCVNPAHLFVGTQQDNITDMFNKGRANKAKGVATGKARLSDADVLAIRSQQGTHKSIALRFNVSASLVGYIKQRRRWTHLT